MSKTYYDFNDGNGLVPAHQHVNPNIRLKKGGWVANTAYVAPTVCIEENALVYGYAKILNNVKVCDCARIYGNAKISDNAKIYSCAEIYGNAKILGSARIFGYAKIYGDARISSNAEISGNARIGKGIIINHIDEYIQEYVERRVARICGAIVLGIKGLFRNKNSNRREREMLEEKWQEKLEADDIQLSWDIAQDTTTTYMLKVNTPTGTVRTIRVFPLCAPGENREKNINHGKLDVVAG